MGSATRRPAAATDESPTRGRPRDPRIDDAVREAALDLLVERGYNAFGLEAVARAAGVGHTSIYRRWPSKAHLVHELLFTDEAGDTPIVADDLPAMVHSLVEGALNLFGQPAVLAATPGLLAEFYADPELRRALTDRMATRFRAELRRVVKQAAGEGRVRADVDADVLLDAIAGTVMFALFVDEQRNKGVFVDRLTNLLLRGILT